MFGCYIFLSTCSVNGSNSFLLASSGPVLTRLFASPTVLPGLTFCFRLLT